MSEAPLSTYPVASAYGLRPAGVGLVVIGVGVVAGGLLGFPSWLLVVLAVLLVVTLGGGAWLVARPPTLLTLSGDGYEIHRVRGNPTTRATWREVETVTSRDVAGSPAVVFVLADGRTSILPVALLGDRAVEAQRDIHERLNAAFGYRRLDPD